jgi:hypothetical protein
MQLEQQQQPSSSQYEYEGPVMYGTKHKYCQDCSGCEHTMMECKAVTMDDADSDDNNYNDDSNNIARQMILLNTTITDKIQNNNNNDDWHRLLYGGFLGVEFARDVELQTPMFNTTQENVITYIDQVWNHPDLLQVWEKPVCIVNTAHHDAAIPGLTTKGYLKNVQWYMHLLSSVCHQFVWIATTAPMGLYKKPKQKIEYPQTIAKTKEWGEAVHDMFATDPVLAPRLLFMDVYNASISYAHIDNSMSHFLSFFLHFFWRNLTMIVHQASLTTSHFFFA